MTEGLFIQMCGAGHSGSTLLGSILGGAADAFYLGEAKKIMNIHDLNKPLRKRICKICGEDCVVWSKFKLNGHETLFEDVAAHVNASILIDSTKNIKWIKDSMSFAKKSGFRTGLILLQRDGRGVVNSRVRKYPEKSSEEMIKAWMDQMENSEALFEAHPGPKVRVRYEDLATNPNETIKAICKAFDMPYDDSMLDISSKEHHPFGGNNGTQYLMSSGKITLNERVKQYYEKHSGGIELDLRWKEELSNEHLNLFHSLAGELNTTYAWTEEK